MARKKKRRSKQGLFSKLTNVGLIALGMSRIIQIVFNNIGSPQEIAPRIIEGATFGLTTGGFNVAKGAAFYGPPVAAISTGKVLQWLKRHFPVR